MQRSIVYQQPIIFISDMDYPRAFVSFPMITGSGNEIVPFSYPEPFLREVRRGALAKSITGYRKNMVRKQYPVLELANQMPVRIWIWPEPPPRVRRALGTRMDQYAFPALPIPGESPLHVQ